MCIWRWYQQVSIESGNGSVPDGTEPLPNPMLTQIYNITGPHQAKNK